MKHRRHWYMLYLGECPVCGRDASHRVRVYGRRPKFINRYVYMSEAETYDGCMG